MSIRCIYGRIRRTARRRIFLGVPQAGFARPDVAAFYGASSRFTNSGFGLVASLHPGDYTVVAFAHSAVTGTFNNTAVVAIRVR